MRALLVLCALPLLAGSDTRPTKPQKIETKKFRLELTVPDQHGIYFSAWADEHGDRTDAILAHDGSNGKTVQFIRWFVWFDGCTWEASETITPTSADSYTYAYRERPLSCPDGTSADPNAPTPRDGTVKVFPTSSKRPLSTFKAWAKGWDKPRS